MLKSSAEIGTDAGLGRCQSFDKPACESQCQHGGSCCLDVPDRWLLNVFCCSWTVKDNFSKRSLRYVVMSVCGSNRSLWNQQKCLQDHSQHLQAFENSVFGSVCLILRLYLSLLVLRIVGKAVSLVNLKNSNDLLPWVSNLFFSYYTTGRLDIFHTIILNITERWFTLLGRIGGFTQLWEDLRESVGDEYCLSFILQCKILLES